MKINTSPTLYVKETLIRETTLTKEKIIRFLERNGFRKKSGRNEDLERAKKLILRHYLLTSGDYTVVIGWMSEFLNL